MKELKKMRDLWNKYMYMLTPSQKRWGVFVFFISLVGAVFELLGVSIILPLVQAMINIDELRKITIVATLCDLINISSDGELMTLIIVVVIVVYVVKNLFLSLVSYVRIRYSNKVQREISLMLIKSYIKRGYFFFKKNNTAALMRDCRDYVSGIQTVLFSFFKVVSDILMMLCIFTYMCYSDGTIAVAVVLVGIICMFLILVVFKRIVQRAGKKFYDSVAKSNKWLLQLFNGIKEALVMNKKDYFVRSFENSYAEQQNSYMIQTLALELPAYIIEAVCIIGIMVAVGIRISNMTDAANYIPKLATFAVAAFRILPCIGRISANINAIIFSVPSVNDTYDNFKEANEIELSRLDINRNRSDDLKFERSLKIKNVSFSYPDDKKQILNSINLEIRKGESIGIVGPSGAGKSTVCDMILGLLEPTGGSIKVDDADIFMNRAGWANIVGFVPQSVYLMDDTIRRNIAFGVEDSLIDDADIWEVLEQAQMKSFVESLPAGLDTEIGDRGIRFSGGQGQRLAIARALFTKPEILILDEATSALDNETENAVMDAIEMLQGKKTLIIIAHRLTTVEKCDRIYEIKDGIATIKAYENLV